MASLTTSATVQRCKQCVYVVHEGRDPAITHLLENFLSLTGEYWDPDCLNASTSPSYHCHDERVTQCAVAEYSITVPICKSYVTRLMYPAWSLDSGACHLL